MLGSSNGIRICVCSRSRRRNVCVSAYVAAGALFHIAFAYSAQAQPTVSRSEAIAAALDRSPQAAVAAVAAAEQSIAAAAVSTARQWENPVFSASVTKAAPLQHYSLDIPLDPVWQRSSRIAGAEAALSAARLRYRFATRSIAFDVDTAYTRAQLSRIRSRLSARSALDADSLLIFAQLRRDAGDASELDVELASVFAGQARNNSNADAIAAINAGQLLASLMGVAESTAIVMAGDSLTPPPTASLNVGSRESSATWSPLLMDAANADVHAAEFRMTAERRRRFNAPSLMIGVEANNPGGPGGPLGMAGIAIPLPLFNRNHAGVVGAQAELARAQALRSLTSMQSATAVQSARRDATAAYERATRSATLVASANRIAAMSLLAYREGASTLLVVLEAQRSARELLQQYFDDVAASRNATSLLLLLTSPSVESTP